MSNPVPPPSTTINMRPVPTAGVLPTGASGQKKKKEEEKKPLVVTINNKDEFENYLRTTENKYLLVEFYASWCGPCKLLAMKFQDIAEKYKDKVIVLKIDIDELEEVAVQYNVTKMPAFMIMRDGRKVEQFCGNKPEQLDSVVEKYLVDIKPAS